MIENLSDTVIIPIAGIIFTFVMCYELIQMVIDRNNMHDFPPSDIFKWMMKTFIAVVLVTNTFPIMMGIFDVAQSVISNAAGVIITDTAVGVETLDALRKSLLEMDIGSLLGLYLQSFLMGIIMWALTVCIFIIVYGRMLEIYLMTSLGAIPIATMQSKEWNMGNNYLKALLALRISRLFNHGVRGHLCGANSVHRNRRRPNRSDLELHDVHGSAVLCPL